MALDRADGNYERAKGWGTAVKAASLILAPALVLGVAAGSAYGDMITSDSPTMQVTVDNSSVGDYDPTNPGDERLWIIDVYNASGTEDHNNMVNFTFPAGSADGILGVVGGSYDGNQWAYNVGADNLTFTGFLPGQQGLQQPHMFLTDDDVPIGTGYATATASGDPTPVQFNDVEVATPIPEPTTLALLGLGLAGIVARNSYRRE